MIAGGSGLAALIQYLLALRSLPESYSASCRSGGRSGIGTLTQLVERATALSHENQRLLTMSHSLIVASRRRLNPYWSLSGGSEDDDCGGALLLSVRSRLERGILIPAPHQMWAGHGTGKTCVVCAQKIYPDEVENEISAREGDVEIKLWAHLPWFNVWRWASRVFEAEQRSSETQRSS